MQNVFLHDIVDTLFVTPWGLVTVPGSWTITRWCCGNWLRFINYKPALSPHQWPPGINPSTTSSPPILECCHICNGVLIQCKHILLYSLWTKIKNDVSHHHLYMKELSIGISYYQWDGNTCAWYDGRLRNGWERQMVQKTTAQWIPISVERYIRRILLVQKDWRIEGIP